MSEPLTIKFVIDRSESQSAQKAEIAGFKEIEKVADEAAKRAAAAVKEEARLRRQASDEAKKLAKDQATEAKRLAKEEAEAKKAAAEVAKKALKEQAEAAAQAEARAKGFANTLMSVGGAVTGLGGISSAVSAITERFEAARKSALEAAASVTQYREGLRELAGLKGNLGQTTTELREQLLFRSKTLQSAEAAKTTQEEFLNTAAVNIGPGRKIAEAQARRLLEFTGSLQAVEGGDPAAYGKLGGVVIDTAKGDNLSADDLIPRTALIQKIASIGGAKFGDFANQLSQVGYLAKGSGYESLPQAAALASLISLSTPKEIATGMEQVQRFTRGALLDDTAPPGAMMTPKRYLESVGATDQMTNPEIMRRMFADAQKAEAEAAKAGRKFDPGTYFRQRGYSNIQDISRLESLYGSREKLFNEFLPMASQTPTLADSLQGVARAQAGDPFLQSMQASVSGDLAKTAVGVGPMEFYKNITRQTFNEMRAAGKVSGDYDTDFDRMGVRSAVLEEIRAKFITQGRSLGIGENDLLNQYTRMGGFAGDTFGLNNFIAGSFLTESRQKEIAGGIYESAVSQAGRGGQMMPGMERLIGAAEAQVNATMRLEKLIQPPVLNAQPGGGNVGRAP